MKDCSITECWNFIINIFSIAWNLLIKQISRKQEQVIEVMCKAAMPSTLVKALYLFFDLPPAANENITLSKQKLFVVLQKVIFFDLNV